MVVDNYHYFWTSLCTVYESQSIPDTSGTIHPTYIPLDEYSNIRCHLSFTKFPASSQEVISEATQMVRLFVLFPNNYLPKSGSYLKVDNSFYKCSGIAAVYKDHIEINLLRSNVHFENRK